MGILRFLGLLSVRQFVSLPYLTLVLLLTSVAPAWAAVDMDPALLPDRGQLIRDTLHLERDIAVLRARLSEAGPRALTLYFDLDANATKRFQTLAVLVGGRTVAELAIDARSEIFGGLKRSLSIELPAGDHALEVRLSDPDKAFSESLKFTKGAGRDHIKITVSNKKIKKSPRIELAHEQWGALK